MGLASVGFKFPGGGATSRLCWGRARGENHLNLYSESRCPIDCLSSNGYGHVCMYDILRTFDSATDFHYTDSELGSTSFTKHLAIF